MPEAVGPPPKSPLEKGPAGDGQNGSRASWPGAWRPGEQQPSLVSREGSCARLCPQRTPSSSLGPELCP